MPCMNKSDKINISGAEKYCHHSKTTVDRSKIRDVMMIDRLKRYVDNIAGTAGDN